MNSRIEQLVDLLNLSPHPQGGFLGEDYRSLKHVEPDDGRGQRPALSSMYMLIPAEHPSKMHAVKADEVWHFCEGDPLELYWVDGPGGELHHRTLGPAAHASSPMACVPGGCWRAARSKGAFSLVSCILGPAFDIRDFSPLVVAPELGNELRNQHPALEDLL